MAFTLRGRTVAYDNISAGNATGRERTISGQLPSTECAFGGFGSSTDPGGGTSGVDTKGFSNLYKPDGNSSNVFNTSDQASNYVAATATLKGERLG